jgi:hypothetical protein
MSDVKPEETKEERRVRESIEYNADLKEQLTITLDNITKLSKTLLRIDSVSVRESLTQAENAIRPMLYLLRSVEENDKQRTTDRQH